MRLGKRLAVAAVAVATGALSLAAAGAVNADATSWSCTVSTDTQCPGSGVYPSPGETAGSNSGGVAVVQDEWGANSNLTSQVLSANSGSAWQVTANLSASNKAVLSYPDTQEVVTNSSGDPTPLADYDTLTSSYTDALPSSPGASDDYEAAYDLWLGAGTVSGSQEIMVWTDNHGQTPSGSDTGKTWTDASTGDVYEIWASSPGNPVSLVAKTNATSGSVDLLTMIKWLKTNSYITSTGLNQVDYGFELCSTSGAPETFSVSAYSISATGDGTNGAPGGGTAPTGSSPLASVSAATSVTSTTATINGSVNPEGLATTYQFGYGTSANYNEFSPASPASAGSGTSNEAESATITGLTPSTTYHFAIEAINSDGTTESSDDTFTTAASGGLTEAPTTAPNAPSLSGGTTTSISWNIPSADTATADQWSYFELLVLGTEGAVQHNVDVSTNSATMYLSPAGERYFKVRACNADGCSAYSPSVGYDN
jgi:hypothetical protein